MRFAISSQTHEQLHMHTRLTYLRIAVAVVIAVVLAVCCLSVDCRGGALCGLQSWMRRRRRRRWARRSRWWGRWRRSSSLLPDDRQLGGDGRKGGTDPAGGGETPARTVNARLPQAGAGARPVLTQSVHHLPGRWRAETSQILGRFDERVPLALQTGELGRYEGQYHVSSGLGSQRNKVILILP